MEFKNFIDQLDYIIEKFNNISIMEPKSIQQAINMLTEASESKAERINNLEKQFNDMVVSWNEYREQSEERTKTEVEKASKMLGDQIESVHTTALTLHTEIRDRIDASEIKLQQDLERVYQKLEIIVQQLDKRSNIVEVGVVKKENVSTTQQNEPMSTINNDSLATPRLTRYSMTNMLIKDNSPQLSTPITVKPTEISHTVIVPPPSAVPEFHGRHNESPTQFLIRVQEYAESVNNWDQKKLLKGISQFLRNSALDWHCQLRRSPYPPETWREFEEVFLAQFNSPVRKARQEQEWHDCKQRENESINDFIVRLRTLWSEVKPKETESDLVKHLFCRMRNELLNMVGVSRHASLEEVIFKVQIIEDILFRRAKGERLSKQIKQASSYNAEPVLQKRYDQTDTQGTTSWSNKQNPYNNYARTRNVQFNETRPTYRSYNRNQASADLNMNEILEPPTCFRCGGYGHWKSNCPMAYKTHQYNRNSVISKNDQGALVERSSLAPIPVNPFNPRPNQQQF